MASLSLPANRPSAVGTRFRLHKQIGKGSYGIVYLGVDTADGAKVAVKNCLDVFRTTEDAKRTLREITILRQCRHPNVIHCRTVMRPPSENFSDLWLVLECCDWDLRKVMNTRMKAWSIEHVKRLLQQTLCGLAYLHGANIVHRDLKPANILVTASCDIRICDFGLSREIKPLLPRLSSSAMELDDDGPRGARGPIRTLTKHVVTRYYRPPELTLLRCAEPAPI
eukprot:SAG11_NODE_3487_length_2417_cov_1.462899_2_plen_224_part_00